MNLKIELPAVLDDNSAHYVQWLLTATHHADPRCDVELHYKGNQISGTIKPSTQDNKQNLIDTLIEAHRRMKLKIEYSKSLKIQKNISFLVNF